MGRRRVEMAGSVWDRLRHRLEGLDRLCLAIFALDANLQLTASIYMLLIMYKYTLY